MLMKKQSTKRVTTRFLAMLTLFVLMVTGSVSVYAFPVGGSNIISVSTVNARQLLVGSDVDSDPLNILSRSTLNWSNQVIGYDTRMRFISLDPGGYFTLDGGTAVFTVSIVGGASAAIEIDWYDSNGNSTVLYTGTTSSKTVSYYSSGRQSGNFRVWNKSYTAITVNASITY